MTFSYFNQEYYKILLFVLVYMIPLSVYSTHEVEINEKRINVTMRMIGHELLMSLNDCESRVLPIERVEKQYKITFEVEFGIDPDDIVSTVNRVIRETKFAMSCIVEVEQCETKEVVYVFAAGSTVDPSIIPCRGRVLPKDCYHLLVTIPDITPIPNHQTDISDTSLAVSGLVKKSNPMKSALLIGPMILLIGFVGYAFLKKNHTEIDPNLVLIGASQFDKKNMALSFKNSKIGLSNKEVELLSVLHDSANAPIEREVILQRVWGDEGDYVGRTLDVFISKLRKKLEADTSVKIVNIRGIGYKLVMDVGS